MRIVAGRLGGRRLLAPKGAATRPTSDKVREALFDILGPLDGLVVADLFAGSGALGLEALSRGAARAVLVELAAEPLAVIRANLAGLGLGPPEAVLLRRDLTRSLGFLTAHGPFDLILADPPYGQGWGERLLTRLPAGLLGPGGRLVVETATTDPRPEARPWRLVQERRYGQTRLLIYQQESP